MTYINIRVLPRGFDTEHARVTGEGIFCDLWGRPDEDTCDGSAEIEITLWSWRGNERDNTRIAHLCRQHAHDLVRQLEDAITLCDGRDLMNMQGGDG